MAPKIRLAVNARQLMPGKIGGLENAFRDVFDILLRRYADEFEVTVLTSIDAEDSFDSWKDLVRVQVVPEEKAPGSLAAALADQDVLYCPFFRLEPERPALPSVVMIPDLQHEVFPEFFSADALADRLRTVRLSCCLASRVLTISEFSKRDIVNRFHLPDEHVAVTHLDCAPGFHAPPDTVRLAALRDELELPDRYVLFPANNWLHKNHRGLFRALGAYRRRHGDAPHVVLTGALVEGANLRDEAAAAGVSDLVRHIGFVEKRDVPLLYDGAACLAFVTLFEGFGIPVVEAMRRGTPVIASDTTSIPEIAGEHALLVDPRDFDAIADALHQVFAHPDEARARAGRARQWVERFSHEGAADKAAELFRQVRRVDVSGRSRSASRPDAKPSVFIVTPSFNQGEFLRDTIESVLSQDYDNLEYFVADGGSTDDSVDILKSYGDRIRWVSEPDGGQAAAINEAWNRSDAEIVAWIDSDDTYLPGAVSEAVRYLLAHPEKAMVYGNAWYTDRQGRHTEPYPTKPFDPEVLRGERFICQPSAFVRREVFGVIDLPDPSLHFCLDYDLWIRLSKRFEVGYVDEYLATSRMYEDNKTLGQRDALYVELIGVVQKHYGQVGLADHAVGQLMSAPLVSVVMPSFNQARFLARAIDSVLSQDYAPLELIVMDGGSTDGSVEILESYGERISFVSERDEGQADAINRGFSRARGEILGWLNSDDLYCPGAVLHAVAELVRDPAATMVYGEAELIGEHDEILGPFPWTQDFDLWRLARVSDYIMQPTVFMRASAFREVGGLDPDLHYGLDWDLWIRLACLGPVLRCREVLAQTREYADTKTATGGFKRLRELRRIMARHGARGVPPGAVAYGLDTLRKLWPAALGSSSAADGEAASARWLMWWCGPIRFLVSLWTDRVLRHSQGVYPDGWVARRGYSAVPWRGDGGVVRLEGEASAAARLLPLEVRVEAAGRSAAVTVDHAGEFAVDLELPRPGGDPRVLEIVMRSDREVEFDGDHRRLSFKLRSVELTRP